MTEKYPAPLTLLQAEQYLREVVAKAGNNFVYEHRDLTGIPQCGTTSGLPSEGCLYVWNDAPDCGVGRVLARHGVPLDVLRKWEGVQANAMGPVVKDATSGLSAHGSYRLTLGEKGLVTEEAACFLAAFQLEQDAGDAWGDALRYALKNAAYRASRKAHHTSNA
jgi:hypothetical protein